MKPSTQPSKTLNKFITWPLTQLLTWLLKQSFFNPTHHLTSSYPSFHPTSYNDWQSFEEHKYLGEHTTFIHMDGMSDRLHFQLITTTHSFVILFDTVHSNSTLQLKNQKPFQSLRDDLSTDQELLLYSIDCSEFSKLDCTYAQNSLSFTWYFTIIFSLLFVFCYLSGLKTWIWFYIRKHCRLSHGLW